MHLFVSWRLNCGGPRPQRDRFQYTYIRASPAAGPEVVFRTLLSWSLACSGPGEADLHLYHMYTYVIEHQHHLYLWRAEWQVSVQLYLRVSPGGGLVAAFTAFSIRGILVASPVADPERQGLIHFCLRASPAAGPGFLCL